MKKVFMLFIIGVMISNTPICADDEPIIINPIGGGSSSPGGRPHKNPVICPEIHLKDNNVLMFDDSCIGCTIVLYQDNQVVFTATVSDSAEIQLPTTLSGNFTLEIMVGSIVFIGEFQL